MTMLPSYAGICKDKPRAISGLRPMRDGRGVVGKAWSSLLMCLSRKVGEGASVVGVIVFGGSEKERDLEGVLAVGEAVSARRGGRSISKVVSIVQLSDLQQFNCSVSLLR